MAAEGVCEMSALYEKLVGRPLFTREILEAANSITHQINDGELKSEQIYQVPDLLGNFQTLRAPKLSKDEKFFLQLNCYQRHAMNTHKNGAVINPDGGLPFKVIAVPTTSHTRDKECHVKPCSSAKWETWKTQWDKDKYSTLLSNIIIKNADQLRNIDQVLCFALGSLHAEHKPKPYIQHLAACTIRNTLESLHQHQDTQRTKITILAQDPMYCKQCVQVLSRLHIKTVTDFSGFLEITENTLVVAISPSAPVLQVIADLTINFNGPRAMLCNSIEGDDLKLNGQFVKLSNEDEPTRNMIAYRDSCDAEVFSDDLDYAERYGDIEEIRKIRKRVVQEFPGLWEHVEPPNGATIRENEGAGDKIQGLLEHAQDYHSKKIRSNFRNLRVYVKRG